MSKCRVCRAEFVKRSITHKCCGPDCAEEWAKLEREKLARRTLRARKAAMKTRSQWLKEAQAAFNAFIRHRDKHLPCVSCGRFHTGSWDAGHFRSVGAAPQLRFNEDNVHRQCVPCNQHKSGNAVEYRINLIKRIGVDRVEFLEGAHDPARYTIEDAIRIKAEYKARLKGVA